MDRRKFIKSYPPLKINPSIGVRFPGNWDYELYRYTYMGSRLDYRVYGRFSKFRLTLNDINFVSRLI